jgi:hypothetical protein
MSCLVHTRSLGIIHYGEQQALIVCNKNLSTCEEHLEFRFAEETVRAQSISDFIQFHRYRPAFQRFCIKKRSTRLANGILLLNTPCAPTT